MTRPRPFRVWLAAATVSTTGDSVSFFALAWFATAYGPGAASLVLTVESIPLCALILAGGAFADRYGARRMMIGCDAAMVGVMGLLALATVRGVPLWALVVGAALAGTAAALRRPAEGVFPRLFSTGDELARRMAVVGGCLQVARVAGPGLGGVLVAGAGMPGAAAFDAVTFVGVLLVLLRVRPPREADHVAGPRGRTWAAIADGVRAAAAAPRVPTTVLAVMGLASSVLPLVMLCVPLLGRERQWSPAAVGIVSAAWVAGGLLVTVVVARRGVPRARVAAAGPVLAATGVVLLAVVDDVLPAVLALATVGAGVTLVTARLLPAFVERTPPDMLARFQSLLGLAQTGPVLVATPLLGLVAHGAGLGWALVAVAALLVATAVPVALLG
ncbi:MFS transporter [Nocardioides sp. T2.26MG-1]|uniref:MFS transporter n=1 Tax=Nocardioides sp. T2.26MG-1 TaxID=3041166 RepID=UPI0024779E33|nr:MFS transporter [Nocardioides sp. T2.26MG-1]CAI9406438.1 hypothetical protein HIDPHFAB_04583 [Nocardioides sp. T2.26MG-1]